MQGKILGVQNGSSGYDGFESQPDVLKKFVKDQTPILYDGFNEAFLDLKSGRIDGLLIDRVYANYYLSHEDNLKTILFLMSAMTMKILLWASANQTIN